MLEPLVEESVRVENASLNYILDIVPSSNKGITAVLIN